MTRAELTLEKILEAKRRIDALGPPPFSNDGLNLFGTRPFMGMNVYEAPDPPPKISLRPHVADLVGAEFAAQVNLWLLNRFGRQESMFDGNRAFIMGSYGIVLSKYNAALLRNIVA